MTLRGRLIALAVGLAVVFSAAIVVLVRTRTPDCTVVAPRPSLSSALRALGDFDQAYDANDSPALEDAATRAAGALYGDLIGTTAELPVAVDSGVAASPDAVVVPLRSHVAPSQGPAPLAGLVVFLRDCQGNAYFNTVEDDASRQPPLVDFPSVSRAQAAQRLGSSAVQLEYVGSPLRPRWATAGGGTAQFLPAR